MGDRRHLLAARYGVDAEQLVHLDKAVLGIDVKRVPKEARSSHHDQQNRIAAATATLVCLWFWQLVPLYMRHRANGE